MRREGDGRAAMRTLKRLVRGIRVAMMTTTAEDGKLHSRPMAVCDVFGEEGSLWFFTSLKTQKVREINVDHRVNITFAKPDADRYVALSGSAEIVQDRLRMRSLWNPEMRTWFPAGLDDPDLALLRVRVEHAEYWDPSAGRLSVLAGRVRSALSRSKPYPAKHGCIDLPRAA